MLQAIAHHAFQSGVVDVISLDRAPEIPGQLGARDAFVVRRQRHWHACAQVNRQHIFRTGQTTYHFVAVHAVFHEDVAPRHFRQQARDFGFIQHIQPVADAFCVAHFDGFANV